MQNANFFGARTLRSRPVTQDPNSAHGSTDGRLQESAAQQALNIAVRLRLLEKEMKKTPAQYMRGSFNWLKGLKEHVPTRGEIPAPRDKERSSDASGIPMGVGYRKPQSDYRKQFDALMTNLEPSPSNIQSRPELVPVFTALLENKELWANKPADGMAILEKVRENFLSKSLDENTKKIY